METRERSGYSSAMSLHQVPEPQCQFGYPHPQLQEMLGARYPQFMKWMSGQTQSICDGRSYDHEKREYQQTGCGPHGPVVYVWDLDRWLAGLPVVD